MVVWRYLCTFDRTTRDFGHRLCKNAPMDWDDLRFALAIAREGSLTGAARVLGVTHTTVGRRLRALEDELGVLLFHRTPEGFQPTVAGQDLAEVGARLGDEVTSLEARVLGRDTALRGSLHVSTLDIVFKGFSDLFQSFCKEFPGVELTISSTMDEVSLAHREADVAIRMSNAPAEHLVGRRVGRVAFAVYGSVDLVDRIGPTADYGAYPWLHWDERAGAWFDAWLGQHAPGARVALRLDFSPMLVEEALLAGIGVQFQPCFTADSNPRLRRIGPVHPEMARDLWLLVHPDLRSTRRVRAFLDHLDAGIRAQADRLAGLR